jgi:hypothetical protein
MTPTLVVVEVAASAVEAEAFTAAPFAAAVCMPAVLHGQRIR